MDSNDPSIARFSFEGDIEAAKEQVGLGRKLLAGLLHRMRLAGLQTGALAHPLGDDGYVYVRVNGGINAVRIIVGSRIGVTQEHRIVLGAPDFVSGVVTDGRIMQKSDPANGTVNYLAKFYPTPQTTQTHRDLRADQAHGMERLAVRPHDNFPELFEPENARWPFSQYSRLRPTMYSGTMKKVVQALMGFGRQLPRTSRTGQDDVVNLAGEDPINPTRTRSIYARVLQELLEEATGKAPPPTDYERDVAKNGLQIRYDYRFSRTHGVYKADDGTLYLVEISQGRGVLCMELPLLAVTKKPPPPEFGQQPEPWKFYEALEALKIDTSRSGGDTETVEVRDEDGLRLLEEFGGFPTGESFPSKQDLLDAMIRAGEVVELLPAAGLEPFYRHSFYSTAMGWAFSESGKEAHNTGYRFEADGVQRGVHYAINLQIAKAAELAPAPGADAIQDRVKSAASSVDNGTALRPILERKALRLSEAQVLELQRLSRDDADFIQRLDQMTVPPVATGTATLRLQREGYLINPGTMPRYQIKFHEPVLGYLLSHDFLPEIQGRGIRERCDTTMHVFFDGEELKWVRYFYDPTQSAPETVVEDDYEECMLVGSWTRTETTGGRAVTRGYYTGDYDDRQVFGETQTVTKIKSEYLGATSVQVGDDPADIRRNFCNRTHTFKRFTDITSESGQDMLTAIAVPNGTREAYYMAAMEYSESYSHTQSYQYIHQTDRYWAEGWRCIISTAGFAYWPDDMQECPPGCDTRMNYPGYNGVGENPRVARYINQNDFPCVDFTDKGPWVKKCDNLDALVYNIPLPPLPIDVYEGIARKAHLDVRLVLGGEPQQKIVLRKDYKDATWVMPMWFIPSPDPETDIVQFIACTFSALGDRPSAAFDTDINSASSPPDRYGSPAYETMAGSNTCYIGVI